MKMDEASHPQPLSAGGRGKAVNPGNFNVQNEILWIKQEAVQVRNAVLLLEQEKDSLRKAIRKLKVKQPSGTQHRCVKLKVILHQIFIFFFKKFNN